jgi:hypothetical protein
VERRSEKSFIPDLTLPTHEAEFLAFMEAVDQHLQSLNVPITGRPMRGWLTISHSLGLGLSLFPREKREPRPGCYTGDDLVIRIFRWFEARYGERLNIYFGPGRCVLLIRGDPWIVALPRIWGRCIFFASPSVPSSDIRDDLRLRRVPRLNVLDLIEELPDGMKMNLTQQELRDVLNRVRLALPCFTALAAVRTEPLVDQAMADFDAFVTHSTASPPALGLARWSSLQSVEKTLKAFVRIKGGSFNKVHDLLGLHEQACACGLPPLPHEWLRAASCRASVRYGEEPTTLGDAMAAHWAAIPACGRVARALLSIRPSRDEG